MREKNFKNVASKKFLSLMLFLNNIKLELMGMMLAGACSPVMVHANGKGGAATDESGDGGAVNLIITLLGKIIDLFPAIGIILALVGAFKLFMAFRNDQPDAYSGAAKDIVIGVALIVFKAFIWTTITGLV